MQKLITITILLFVVTAVTAIVGLEQSRYLGHISAYPMAAKSELLLEQAEAIDEAQSLEASEDTIFELSEEFSELRYESLFEAYEKDSAMRMAMDKLQQSIQGLETAVDSGAGQFSTNLALSDLVGQIEEAFDAHVEQQTQHGELLKIAFLATGALTLLLLILLFWQNSRQNKSEAKSIRILKHKLLEKDRELKLSNDMLAQLKNSDSNYVEPKST